MKSHASYEPVGEIGRGRLATVYRVRDLALKREVAVKELNDEARRDEQQLQRFWEEARFLANIEHDNVVQIYGLDRERGWVIMELAAGGLDATVARGPLPPEVVRGALRQVLDGLDCLHHHGRVHGALKPSNLLITHQGIVKLSDAAGADAGRAPGVSAKYLAPEQIVPSLGPVGPAADLYALGFTALELLAGPGFDALFPGVASDPAGPQSGWRAVHLSGGPAIPAATDAVPGLPADLARVIDRLLRKDGAGRYAGAADALKDVEDVPAPPVPGAPPPATPPARAEATAAGKPRPPTHRGEAVGKTGRAEEGPARETLLPTVFPVQPSPARVTPAPSAAPASGPHLPALETVRDGPVYPRWSRRWINQKLENPRVLYPLCATIVFVTVLLLADLFLRRWPSTPPSPPTTSPPTRTVEVDVVPPVSRGETPVVTPPPTTAAVLPPTKPPVRPPAERTLRVESTPGKATVYVDGKRRGETPFADRVPPGRHRVRLERDKHKAFEQVVDVPSDRDPAPINATLERLRDPRSSALLVGVRSAAAGLPVFRHAPGDVAELGRVLLAAGYPEGRVRVLTQSANGRPDTAPTADRIRGALDALVSDCAPGDTLLLALAGPVVVGPGGSEAFFCPAGADLGRPGTLVALKDVFQKLAACPAGTKFVLVDGNRLAPGLPARPEPARVEPLVPAGVAALVATANGAPGYVHADERHGAFWAFVLRGLRGAAGAKGGKVTAGALAGYVAEATRAYVAGAYKGVQTPVLADPAGKVADAPLAAPDAALLALGEGDALLDKKEYAKAAEKFGQAIALRKDLIEACLRRAEAYIRGAEGPRAVDDYDAAIKDCEDALRLDPGNAAALDFRGDGHFFKAGRVSGMNQDEMRLAVLDFSAAIEADPDFAPSFISRGSARGSLAAAYARQKQPDQARAEDEQALADFSKAIELAPLPQGIYYEDRARVNRRLKDNDGAVADYTEALRLADQQDKNRVFFLHYNRGQAHLSRRDFERAEADFAEAARLKPDDPDAVLYLARALKRLGRAEEARTAEQKAAELKRRRADKSD